MVRGGVICRQVTAHRKVRGEVERRYERKKFHVWGLVKHDRQKWCCRLWLHVKEGCLVRWKRAELVGLGNSLFTVSLGVHVRRMRTFTDLHEGLCETRHDCGKMNRLRAHSSMIFVKVFGAAVRNGWCVAWHNCFLGERRLTVCRENSAKRNCVLWPEWRQKHCQIHWM